MITFGACLVVTEKQFSTFTTNEAHIIIYSDARLSLPTAFHWVLWLYTGFLVFFYLLLIKTTKHNIPSSISKTAEPKFQNCKYQKLPGDMFLSQSHHFPVSQPISLRSSLFPFLSQSFSKNFPIKFAFAFIPHSKLLCSYQFIFPVS